MLSRSVIMVLRPLKDAKGNDDVERILLGSRPLGPGMGKDHGPAGGARLVRPGARPVRGPFPGDRPGGHPDLPRGEPGRPPDAPAGRGAAAGRREGDRGGGGEGLQGRLPFAPGAPADRPDGARGGADPQVLRGPPGELPAPVAPRPRDPAAARRRRGDRVQDRLRGERPRPGVGRAGVPPQAARERPRPPAGDRGPDRRLAEVRPPRPGDVRHRPLGPAGDPLQDRVEGDVQRDRPRHLAERADRLLRAGGAGRPEQRGPDGGARGRAGGGEDPGGDLRPRGAPVGGAPAGASSCSRGSTSSRRAACWPTSCRRASRP